MAESRPSIKEPKPSKPMDLETAVEKAYKREAQAFGIKSKKRPAYVQQKTDEHFDAADRIVAAREKGLKEGQIDPLTKLPLRSHLTEALTRVHGLKQHGAKVDANLLIIDVDNFKWINDNLGHPVGDDVLVALADFLRNNTRESDTVVRWGGEEIAILLENAAANGVQAPNAKEYANRIKDGIRGAVAKAAGIEDKRKVTVSVGFSSFRFDPDKIDPHTGKPALTSIEDITKEADLALYRAKRTGKDKVVKFNKRMLPEENVEAEEAKVSPGDFLELALNYLSANLVKEAGELKTMTEKTTEVDDPLYQQYFSEIVRGANDLEKYLPMIVSATREAIAGKPVKIINTQPRPFFHAGVLSEKEDIYKPHLMEKTFTPDQIPEIISLLNATLETRSRHDIAAITGYSELSEKTFPKQEQSFDPIMDIALDIDDKIFMLGNLAKKVIEDGPINIASTDGQKRIVLDKAA